MDPLVQLRAQCASDTYPTLLQTELQDVLDSTARYTVWKAATAYHYGDVVLPTVRVGHIYKCIVAGTSSTTEPFWPLYTAPDDRVGLTRPHWHGFVGPLPGSQMSDGTVVWLEAGPDSLGQYDVRRATYMAWQMKAAKASADFDTEVGSGKYTRSQVIANCMAMAQKYAPTGLY